MWHVPKVVLERVSARDVAGWLSKGSSGGVWFRRGFSKAVSKRVFREGASESFRDGVFEGGCEGVFRKGFREVLPRRAAMIVGSKMGG